MRRFPVTNADYIEFLDDLVATGREEEALLYVPRQPGGRAGELGAMIYGRNPSGRFELVVDADGDCWLPDWPVVLVDWHGAWAYAAWTSARDGLPWRLPGELEWEKAARGVDGRIHPWGDGFDPSWTCMSHSHPGRRLPVPVDSFPIDESPYGVRGMAGNVMEWTQDLYRPSGPPLEHQRVLSMDRPELPLDADRTRRGGGWNFMAMTCRGAYRGRNKVLTRFGNLGFRLARSWRRHP
jgi:serine/threonine-protein kinase